MEPLCWESGDRWYCWATSLCAVYPLDFAPTGPAADLGKLELRGNQRPPDCLVKISKSDEIRGLPEASTYLCGVLSSTQPPTSAPVTLHRDASGPKDTHFCISWMIAQSVTAVAGGLPV